MNEIPAIAQLVEHLTVDAADIRWSLVRFRVAGFVAMHLALHDYERSCFDNQVHANCAQRIAGCILTQLF